jgi:Zn-dependent peptidase ImmA (M78 family)
MILKSLNTSLIDLLPTDINRIAEVAAPFSSICSEDQAIEVAEMEHIEVGFMPFRESKGMLIILDNEYKMTINSILLEHERTQAILHEIGHFMLHWDNRICNSFFCHKYLVNQIEKKADFFSWLLVTKDIVEIYR